MKFNIRKLKKVAGAKHANTHSLLPMKPAFIIPIAIGRKEVRDKDTINVKH